MVLGYVMNLKDKNYLGSRKKLEQETLILVGLFFPYCASFRPSNFILLSLQINLHHFSGLCST